MTLFRSRENLINRWGMTRQVLAAVMLGLVSAGGVANEATTGVLSGQVTNAQGQAVAGVSVMVVSQSDDASDVLLQRRQFSAVTNQQGQFEVGAAPAGPVSVVAVEPGPARYQKHESVHQVVAGQRTIVSIRLEPSQLPRQKPFGGTVRDATTGEPIQGATIVISVPGQKGKDRARTRSDGRFIEIISSGEAASIDVVITKRGYEKLQRSIGLAGHSPKTTVFQLVPKPARSE